MPAFWRTKECKRRLGYLRMEWVDKQTAIPLDETAGATSTQVATASFSMTGRAALGLKTLNAR